MKRVFALFLLLSSEAWAQSPPSQQAGTEFGSNCPYPEAARKAGIQGTTSVAFQVADDGTAKDVSLLSSSGDSEPDDAATRCVANWRISPASEHPSQFMRMRNTVINWSIPASAKEPAVGRFGGRPHVCGDYYPLDELKQGIGGVTIVSFRIKTSGDVSNIKVAQSSGNTHLDEAAVACARNWRYLPAVENGKPVEVPWKAKVTWKAPAPLIPPQPSP